MLLLSLSFLLSAFLSLSISFSPLVLSLDSGIPHNTLPAPLPQGRRFYDSNLTLLLCPITDKAVIHIKGRRQRIVVQQ